MKQGYFVTGTGTGVGKTHVTAALAALAHSQGRRVFAFKPIETGCPNGTLGADQQRLVTAAGGWQTGELVGVYQFERPAAPIVAAPLGAISFARIQRVFDAGSKQADLTLIEGAGGWRVPISGDSDMSTLARLFGLPVLVVATAALGTINHTLLTIEAVERDQQCVAGVILSQLPSDDVSLVESNLAQLRARWSGRPDRILVLTTNATVLQPFLDGV